MASESYRIPSGEGALYGVATKHGQETGLMLKHSGDVHQDIYGEETGTVTYQVFANDWSSVPGPAGFSSQAGDGSSHPYISYLKFESREVNIKPGIWEVKVKYRGIPTTYHNNDGTPPVYELNYGSGTEPIETHPNFERYIGGTPSAPKNGAIFVDANGDVTTDDAVGVFERFKIVNPDNADLSFGGIESYLDMNNITWTKTWATKDMSNLNVANLKKVKVDSVEDDPLFPAPTFRNRNWLYLGISSTGVRGDSARHKATWKLSGIGKWNKLIYNYTPT
jgi:hypothetical protein